MTESEKLQEIAVSELQKTLVELTSTRPETETDRASFAVAVNQLYRHYNPKDGGLFGLTIKSVASPEELPGSIETMLFWGKVFRDPFRVLTASEWSMTSSALLPSILGIFREKISRFIRGDFAPVPLSRQFADGINRKEGLPARSEDMAYIIALYRTLLHLGVSMSHETMALMEYHECIFYAVGPSYEIQGKTCTYVRRPIVHKRDARGRLHCENGPALVYEGQYESEWHYAIHGVDLSGPYYYIVTNPKQITVDSIRSERNQEVRRIMVERFGADRFIKEGLGQLRSKDAYGTLYEIPRIMEEGGRNAFWMVTEFDIEMTIVEVVNGTPEPDGTWKKYYLMTPPNMRTAHEAVAWTYGLTAEQYKLVKRT